MTRIIERLIWANGIWVMRFLPSTVSKSGYPSKTVIRVTTARVMTAINAATIIISSSKKAISPTAARSSAGHLRRAVPSNIASRPFWKKRRANSCAVIATSLLFFISISSNRTCRFSGLLMMSTIPMKWTFLPTSETRWRRTNRRATGRNEPTA